MSYEDGYRYEAMYRELRTTLERKISDARSVISINFRHEIPVEELDDMLLDHDARNVLQHGEAYRES